MKNSGDTDRFITFVFNFEHLYDNRYLVVLKLKIQKNHFNKKWAPKLLFFNENDNF